MALFIPKKVKVGFQNRSGTYTNKLAYVIYYDDKGKLRKEASWKSWKSDSIPVEDYDNVPTEGFVLNKKAGGYSTGWNHRQSYIRVYDPRGFEFEITPENLLFILENTNSIKGKGLEGEFVYAWDGKDLVLLPTDTPEYRDYQNISNKTFSGKRFTGKDMIVGATYLCKDNREYVYLGRFSYYDRKYEYTSYGIGLRYNTHMYKEYNRYNYVSVEKGRRYFFYDKSLDSVAGISVISTLSKYVIDVVSEEVHPNYANIVSDYLEHSSKYSPIKDIVVDILPANHKKLSSIEYWQKFVLKIYDKYVVVTVRNDGNNSFSVIERDSHKPIFTITKEELLSNKYNLGELSFLLENGNICKDLTPS